MNKPPLFNYFSTYYNNDTMALKNMVDPILNDVSKDIREISYDYEYFLKLNNYSPCNQWN